MNCSQRSHVLVRCRHQHWGAGNVVDNCIMANLAAPADASNPGSSIDTWNGGGYFHGDWFNSFNFTRNIVYITQGSLFSNVGYPECVFHQLRVLFFGITLCEIVLRATCWRRYANCTFDHNLYYSTNVSSSPIEFPPPGPRGGTGKRISPAAWQALGKDRHSLFGIDPMFVDPTQMDFRLQTDSPALNQIGFETWNYSDVGPVGRVGVGRA